MKTIFGKSNYLEQQILKCFSGHNNEKEKKRKRKKEEQSDNLRLMKVKDQFLLFIIIQYIVTVSGTANLNLDSPIKGDQIMTLNYKTFGILDFFFFLIQ